MHIDALMCPDDCTMDLDMALEKYCNDILHYESDTLPPDIANFNSLSSF